MGPISLRDDARADAWFRRAFEALVTYEFLEALGGMLRDGRGKPHDLANARRALEQFQREGSQDAGRILRQLDSR